MATGHEILLKRSMRQFETLLDDPRRRGADDINKERFQLSIIEVRTTLEIAIMDMTNVLDYI